MSNVVKNDPSEVKRSEKEISARIGQRVRLMRRQLGWSQTELARRMGITFQQVHKYETGGTKITAGRLHHIATVLQKPVGWFYDDNIDSSSFHHLAMRMPHALNTIKDRTIREWMLEIFKIAVAIDQRNADFHAAS